MCEIEKKLVDKAFDYVDKIINPPFEQVGGLFVDQVRFWRYKNQINIILKAQEFHKLKGISPRKVPIKTLANLLNNASFEEDELLQQKWINLLINATDPANKYNSHFTLTNLLNELTHDEVMVLDYILTSATRLGSGTLYFSDHNKRILLYMNLHHPEKYSYVEIEDRIKEELIIDNLIRLNIIKFNPSKIENLKGRQVNYDNIKYKLKTSITISLTRLGEILIKECNVESNEATPPQN